MKKLWIELPASLMLALDIVSVGCVGEVAMTPARTPAPFPTVPSK